MKKLTDEEQALKDLIEDTEAVYRGFRTAFKAEIPRKPTGEGDSRIHRIEGLWHEMRKELEEIQTKYVQAQIEECEEDAYNETFRHLAERM